MHVKHFFVNRCKFSDKTVIGQSGGLLTQPFPPGDQTFCSVWNISVTIHFLNRTTLLLLKTKETQNILSGGDEKVVDLF